MSAAGSPRLVDVRRTPPRTLLTAALLMPAVHLVAAGLSGAVTPVTPSAAALTLVVFILGAIPEELGWTAYATGPMQERFGVTGAGMAIGAVWAGWHVVPWLSMGHSWRWVAWQSAVTVAMRIIMGHLFRMSGRSAATALLFHAVSNASLEILPGAVEPRRTAIVATLLILLAAGVTKREPEYIATAGLPDTLTKADEGLNGAGQPVPLVHGLVGVGRAPLTLGYGLMFLSGRRASSPPAPRA
ncbi:CPBP family intramembrane metalloprotease [Corynebacterium suedekumii]|nr:CPBP family intramembrane metalloprotease [Corynebacterium suedekumii]